MSDAGGMRFDPPHGTGRIATANAPGRTRTSNLLVRSQPLYPIELRALLTGPPSGVGTDLD